MVIGVRQQGQETRAFDGGVELTLVVGLGTGKTCRNDLAVFLDEITQCVEIFVIDFVDIGSCKAADLAALAGYGRTLRAGSGHPEPAASGH